MGLYTSLTFALHKVSGWFQTFNFQGKATSTQQAGKCRTEPILI